MWSYALQRILLAIPTLLIVSIAVFVLMRVVPGDPAALLVGDGENPERVARLRAEMGLDRPLPVQLTEWLGGILRGDFGRSLLTDRPVLPLMLRRFGVTLQIVAIAVTLASLIALPLGTIAAWRQDRRSDAAIVFASVAAMSIPSFWIGLMLILVFGIELGWLPAVGYVSLTEDLGRGLVYLIMPVTALVLAELGTIIRIGRAATLEILRLDYIAHARSKGLTERAVLLKHAFPNAFAPTLTVIGLIFGSLLGGAAVIETVFTLPGLGRYLIDAISARDYPVVQGVLLLVAFCYVTINLLTDLLYPLFDPRVRL